MVQVAQDQLEAVLRCAGTLRIRGLESEFSRESSLDPENSETRPSSQQSGSSKRKTSPKFHFLKNRRKCLFPSKLEEPKHDDTVHDDVQDINDDETEAKVETNENFRSKDVRTVKRHEFKFYFCLLPLP